MRECIFSKCKRKWVIEDSFVGIQGTCWLGDVQTFCSLTFVTTTLRWSRMYADAPLPSRGWTISSKMLYTEVLGTYAELPPAFLRVATKVELYSCCDEKFCSFCNSGGSWSLPEEQ